MDEDYSAFLRNKRWDLVYHQTIQTELNANGLIEWKKTPNGTIVRHKTRLVAKRYTQQHGFNCNETFSPIVKLATIRVVLTMPYVKTSVLGS